MSIHGGGVSGSGFISNNRLDNGLTPIHGMAIGSNDVTFGSLSQERKLWIPEVLEESAHTLIGKQIVVDHENRSAREVVGQVTDARFDEELGGVVYQGVLDDEDLAEKIGHGWLEVSPRIIHSDEMEERDNVKIPQQIHEFDNLSIVSRGAAGSNYVDLGEHEELSVEELQESFESPPSEDSVVELQRRTESFQDGIDLTDYMFDNPNGAVGAGEQFDCSGYHEHTVNDETVYMPCATHEDFLRSLQEEEMDEVEELILSEARDPVYSETETKSWGDIPADQLEYYVDALGYDDVEQVDDLTESQKNEIAEHSLLGDADADSVRELRFFPVVNAESGDLNRGALEAVRSGRGQSADIPQSTYDSAYSKAARLLNDEFGTDVDTELSAEELAASNTKNRISGQISSHSELTREEARLLLESIDPSEPDNVDGIALAASKALEAIDYAKLRKHLDEMVSAGEENEMGIEKLSEDKLDDIVSLLSEHEELSKFDEEEISEFFDNLHGGEEEVEENGENESPEDDFQNEDIHEQLRRMFGMTRGR